MAYTFLTPKKIVSGENALTDAKNELKKLGHKAFIVTDATMVKLGNVALLEDVLKQNETDYFIFDEVKYNSSFQKYKQ